MEKVVEKPILIFMLLFDKLYYVEYSSIFINIFIN